MNNYLKIDIHIFFHPRIGLRCLMVQFYCIYGLRLSLRTINISLIQYRNKRKKLNELLSSVFAIRIENYVK